MIAGNSQTPVDEPPQGDESFRGVKMRSRSLTEMLGFGTYGRNCRFVPSSTGKLCASPRRGVQLLPWTNRGYSATVQAFGEVHGAVVFTDPSKVDWFIIAADGKTYAVREFMSAREIPLPAGVTLTGSVEFVQCFDQLLLFRGPDLAPLILRDINTAWLTVVPLDNSPDTTEQNPSDGTEVIPNGSRGLYMQNRLFIPFDGDFIAASDFLNYTRYQPTLEAFRINPGENGSITGLAEFNSNTMIVFKEFSVHAVTGVEGDLSGLGRATVTDEYGCSSPKAIITVGKDIWFLAFERGISSITQTEQNKLQGVDVPISEDIQPIIDRINWAVAEQFTAAKWGNFSYWAVALDGATIPNAVIVYDHTNQAFAGYDDGAMHEVRELLVKKVRGKQRLFMLTDSGYLCRYEALSQDQVGASTFAAIDFEFWTRGYAMRSNLGRIRVKELNLQLQTWNPRYSITAELDGVNETTAIATDKTRDRTHYVKPFTAQAYDVTNVNDDHAVPFREDYSVLHTGNDLHLGSGISFGRKQETTESYRVPNAARGQTVRFKITSDQGRVELHGVACETVKVDKQRGVKV